MDAINLADAKAHLSELVDRVEASVSGHVAALAERGSTFINARHVP